MHDYSPDLRHAAWYIRSISYLWFFSIAFIKQLFLSALSVVLMSAPFFNKTLTHRWCPESAASKRDLFYIIKYMYLWQRQSLYRVRGLCKHDIVPSEIGL